jgi:hypothetical protein
VPPERGLADADLALEQQDTRQVRPRIHEVDALAFAAYTWYTY